MRESNFYFCILFNQRNLGRIERLKQHLVAPALVICFEILKHKRLCLPFITCSLTCATPLRQHLAYSTSIFHIFIYYYVMISPLCLSMLQQCCNLSSLPWRDSNPHPVSFYLLIFGFVSLTLPLSYTASISTTRARFDFNRTAWRTYSPCHTNIVRACHWYGSLLSCCQR